MEIAPNRRDFRPRLLAVTLIIAGLIAVDIGARGFETDSGQVRLQKRDIRGGEQKLSPEAPVCGVFVL
jgi:hypothetical protein